MGFYNNMKTTNESADTMLGDFDAYQEGCIYLEMMDLSAEDRRAMVETPEFLALEAQGLIGKRTIVKLKKEDDLERRETMAAFDLARDAADPLWDKLALNRVKERELIGKIKNKYKSKASKIARNSQKDYIKKIKTGGLITKNDINNRM